MGGIVMAATISANSAGGGGLVSSGDASGVLALQTAGVTVLSIDASQQVSINSAQIPTISGTAPLYMCRAWVNFNGTGTVAIRASGNVSSITDTGVGGYTVNFTTAMPDANYAVTGLCSDISVNGAMVNTTTLSTSGVTIATRVPAAYLGSDQALITIAINR